MSRYRTDPLKNSFGAHNSGIDLSQPLDASEATGLVEDLLKFRVLVVREQNLTISV
ncbi:hypothetical protein [Nocardia abscessus]|uniref:hypothetical protein n=1 Tax=Nocardia abscessus TaxID=120957 RepID=UPI00245823D5|nr:hypothetical protein [Nocardia abscessus]